MYWIAGRPDGLIPKPGNLTGKRKTVIFRIFTCFLNSGLKNLVLEKNTSKTLATDQQQYLANNNEEIALKRSIGTLPVLRTLKIRRLMLNYIYVQVHIKNLQTSDYSFILLVPSFVWIQWNVRLWHVNPVVHTVLWSTKSPTVHRGHCTIVWNYFYRVSFVQVTCINRRGSAS